MTASLFPPLEIDGYGVFWTSPASGLGEAHDEQPLPFIVGPQGEQTPRFGGEAGHPGTGVESLPLPGGRLAEPWPFSQRLFNLPRRKVNLYWRYVFESRTPADGAFYFAEQLRFRRTSDGFAGHCPLAEFRRAFTIRDRSIEVADHIRFRRPLRFATFSPVVVALFADTPMGTAAAGLPDDRLCLECDGFELKPKGTICSSTGDAQRMTETLEDVSFVAGQQIERTYRFRLPATRATH